MKISEELKNWETTEEELGSLLHEHFEDFGKWSWCEIAEEGRGVWNEMFNEDVQEDSPIDGIISAVAAQAGEAAFVAVATMLGVDVKGFRYLVDYWYEFQDNVPPPLFIGTKLQDYIDRVNSYLGDNDNEADPPSFLIKVNRGKK